MGGGWRRFVRHVRQRRYLEAYAAISIIFVVSVLGLFGIGETDKLAAAALLAVVPITMLILEILDKLESQGDRSGTWLRTSWPPELERRMTAATDDVVMVGVALPRMLTNYVSHLERRLRAGRSVGIVLVDPEGEYGPNLTTQREHGRPNAERNRQVIRTSIMTIDDELRSDPGLAERVRLVLVDFPIGTGGVLFDARMVPDAEGRVELVLGRNPEMYLERYPFGVGGYEHEHLVVTRQHPHWLDHFRREFENTANFGRVPATPGSGLGQAAGRSGTAS
ncbi:hypothetical protein [Streptosporangium carneum]|uniref:Uncharacterized protein n=1 Tax=Streptosporangium carneum TaxID=47481 RepID=A0A9W6MGN9_9ACTN|nr:hypothetical protein [Streptosporangium carneum]GLK13436.1 hypothetical protein GCM10017600_68470 [Streptosporangium carneum]